MDQFRQIGKVVGSLNALMTFQDNMLNHKQCSLLVDTLASAYDTIADHMRKNLKFDERNTKWKIIEHPLKELVRVFKEGEAYVRLCMDVKENSFFGKAFLLYQNSDCLEFHLHNLLAAVPVAIEAIELAGQISGHDPDEIHKKRFVYSAKYGKDMRDPRIFRLVLGGQYLVSQDACTRMDSVWDEDRWHLLKKIKDMKRSYSMSSKRDLKLADAFVKYLNGEYCNLTTNDVLLPISILVKDYQVRRRLGNGSHYKEIQWLGESFASRHFFGDVENLVPEISSELSLSHPNVLHTLCGFSDEERRECFLVMELMSRDLSGYIKEICGPRKRVPFTLPVAVDLMLQIARGMEYLHSKKIFHGELNPSNVLIRARSVSGAEGYLHAKVSGFGLSQKTPTKSTHNEDPHPSFIWYAPEVLAELQETSFEELKHTEKADVYSFGMICFEVLTGKVPFDELHLQGEKMSRNIRSGERPLFPFHSPKYITALTRKCWHADPAQRPSFSAICRVLRYTKRFLSMNPEHEAVMPAVDLSELEGGRGFSGGGGRVHEIPFEMFAYRVTEREKERGRERENSESGSDGASSTSNCDFSSADDMMFASPPGERNNTSSYKTTPSSPEMMIRKLSLSASKKNMEIKTGRQQSQPGTPPNKGRSPTMTVISRPPHTPNGGRLMRKNSEGHLLSMSPKTRRRTGHASDTEFP